MSIFIEFEHYLDAMDNTGLQYLISMGVSGTAIGNAGLVGVARIETDGRYWQPERSGIPALILPVGEKNSFERMVDMIALQTSAPDIWWTRTGAAPMLGYWNLSSCMYFGTQLTLHANPLEWLRSDCEGICLLDWNCYLPMWLSGIVSIYCPDPVIGERLETRLAPNFSFPEIRVGEVSYAA